MLDRRTAIAASLAAPLVLATRARAQGSRRPLVIIVGAPPGGTADGVGRVLAEAMRGELGGTVVVENRGGGSGLEAAERLVRAEPDGQTLLMANTSVLAINPSLYPRLTYDPLRDFGFVGKVATVPIVLAVRRELGVNSVQELIALAKSRPGTLNFGSAGTATAMHLAGVLFNQMAGTEITHVPFRGSAPAVTNLIGGQGLDMMFEPAATLLQYIANGTLVALAVADGQRAAALPDVPTMSEAGLTGYVATQYFGLVAPAATPAATLNQLSETMARGLGSPATRDRLKSIGAEPAASSPAALRQFVAEEIPHWRELVRISGAKLDGGG
ncbi:tripartite-type tricarboxylate transporter receptor subunit TctC [Humitalea rosea]|uniref:Tripartite-type tricarboxylate transporter receptor subunit TctC n=1 Tax=Humitalea rosea TaxID=990373 RepID=A0A2W7IR75_9PROT|nr:tripartite tricarboxylate transporter substrate-binding protein [Humitalea rosea]PZW41897.1 tripartite-type tricarboxylate transporter receptor subunit TctC [Humitalea rosea]